MITYEVLLIGESEPFYTFEDDYQYSLNERLFAVHSGKVEQFLITKITHDVTKHTPVHRLNCQLKKPSE